MLMYFCEFFSVLGTLSVFYFGILVVGEYFAVDAKPSNIKWAPKSAMDVISLLPSLATGFMFHASAVPVYSCMKERNLKTWRSVIFITMAVIYTVTGMAGIFGYMTFGDDVSSDIMQNYDPRRPEIIVGLVAVMTAQIMTFPMHLFVGRYVM
ncbi:unnamed protein product [Notodromas monacha]|uniref:Amino acid transporter transmembrane domain-containing protein n=1 Tax=Notodromas monacha TaxID=399045 RepID=A0A7R9C192_9CRUS|nr:unnamed protein product [Notodromas monacha]CAG0924616.1 unnamed protein product [Notodromas monacha]